MAAQEPFYLRTLSMLEDLILHVPINARLYEETDETNVCYQKQTVRLSAGLTRFAQKAGHAKLVGFAGAYIAGYCLVLNRLYANPSWNLIIDALEDMPLSASTSAEYLQHVLTQSKPLHIIFTEMDTYLAQQMELNSGIPATDVDHILRLKLIIPRSLQSTRYPEELRSCLRKAAQCIRNRYGIHD